MKLKLRAATESDARLLLEWRNDPLTRRSSKNDRPVAWEDHLRWLSDTLSRGDRRLMIAELDGISVGTVRLDLASDHCELSWTVSPSKRGLGIGKAMVALAIAEARAPTVVAQIKADNVASLRIAESCGFQRVSAERGMTYWRRDMHASSS